MSRLYFSVTDRGWNLGKKSLFVHTYASNLRLGPPCLLPPMKCKRGRLTWKGLLSDRENGNGHSRNIHIYNIPEPKLTRDRPLTKIPPRY